MVEIRIPGKKQKNEFEDIFPTQDPWTSKNEFEGIFPTPGPKTRMARQTVESLKQLGAQTLEGAKGLAGKAGQVGKGLYEEAKQPGLTFEQFKAQVPESNVPNPFFAAKEKENIARAKTGLPPVVAIETAGKALSTMRKAVGEGVVPGHPIPETPFEKAATRAIELTDPKLPLKVQIMLTMPGWAGTGWAARIASGAGLGAGWEAIENLIEGKNPLEKKEIIKGIAGGAVLGTASKTVPILWKSKPVQWIAKQIADSTGTTVSQVLQKAAREADEAGVPVREYFDRTLTEIEALANKVLPEEKLAKGLQPEALTARPTVKMQVPPSAMRVLGETPPIAPKGVPEAYPGAYTAGAQIPEQVDITDIEPRPNVPMPEEKSIFEQLGRGATRAEIEATMPDVHPEKIKQVIDDYEFAERAKLISSAKPITKAEQIESSITRVDDAIGRVYKDDPVMLPKLQKERRELVDELKKFAPDDTDDAAEFALSIVPPQVARVARKGWWRASDIIYNLRYFGKRILIGLEEPGMIENTHPEFKPFMDSVLNKIEDANVVQMDLTQRFAPYLKLTDELKQKVDKALMDGTRVNKEWTDIELIARGLDLDQIAAYRAARKGFNGLYEWLPTLSTKYGHPPEVAQTIINNSRLEGWVPLQRFERYAAHVKDTDGNGMGLWTFPSRGLRSQEIDKVIRPTFHDAQVLDWEDLINQTDAAKALGARILQSGKIIAKKPLILTFDNRRLKGNYQDLLPIPYLSKTLSKAGIPDITVDEVESKLGDLFTQLRMGGSLKRRTLAPGYSEDVTEIIENYVRKAPLMMARFLGKADVERQLARLTNPDLFKRGQDVLDIWTGKAGVENPMVQALGRGLFNMWLGAKPAFTITNMSARLPMTWAELTKHVGIRKGTTLSLKAQGKEFAVYKRMVTNGWDFEEAIRHVVKGKISQNAIINSYKKGTVAKVFIEDIAGSMPTKIEKGLGVFAWASERSNRLHAALGMAEAGRIKGLAGEELENFIRDGIKNSQNLFERVNRPEFFRGNAGSIARIFRMWSVHYYNFINHLIRGPNKRALIPFAVGQMMVAGVKGLPLAAALIAAYKSQMAPEERALWELEEQNWQDNPYLDDILSGKDMSVENFMAAAKQFGKESLAAGPMAGIGYSTWSMRAPEIISGTAQGLPEKMLSVLGGPGGMYLWNNLKTLGIVGDNLLKKWMGVPTGPVPWASLTPSQVKSLKRWLEQSGMPLNVFGKPIISEDDIARASPEIRPWLRVLYQKAKKNADNYQKDKWKRRIYGLTGAFPQDTERIYALRDAMSDIREWQNEAKGNFHQSIAEAELKGDYNKAARLLQEARLRGVVVNRTAINMHKRRIAERR